MVFARTSKAAARLSKQFRRETSKKQYLAVVRGLVPDHGTLENYLQKGQDRIVRVVDASVEDAKFARLQYKRLYYIEKGGSQNVSDEGLSLVQIDLETGRPHQIRVQFSFSGFPIWGDARYHFEEHQAGQQICIMGAQAGVFASDNKRGGGRLCLPCRTGFRSHYFKRLLKTMKIDLSNMRRR